MFSSRDRHPEIVRDSGTSLLALIGAMGVGAALMYFFGAANRTRGALARAQSPFLSSDEVADDAVLVERVRAAMGHVIPDPLAIEVRARDGCVTLKGPAQPHQIGELVACAERVRGVREVDNRLSVSNPS
jgi:osmotically-inducible protein OsmY